MSYIIILMVQTKNYFQCVSSNKNYFKFISS